MVKTNYRVPSHALNSIIFIKKLTKKEEKTLFDNLLKFVETNKSLSVVKYVSHLVYGLLVEPEIIKKQLDGKEQDFIVAFLSEIYARITDIYPEFCIEVVCSKLNGPGSVPDVSDPMSQVERILKEAESLTSKRQKQKQRIVTSLTYKDLLEIKAHLKKNIIGQDYAIEVIMDHLTLIASNLEERASFFFIGPTGVGKSETARLLGQKYSGNFCLINCAEFSGGHEMAKLIGAPPGYVGHHDKPLLKEKADKSNRWVFLFDEIEKAHPKFYNFLLSLLDYGKLQDNCGNELDFSKSIFIFTSNKGISDIKYEAGVGFKSSAGSYANSKDIIERSIKEEFSPEFRNRIDEFVFFNELTEDDAKKIAVLNLAKLPINKTNELLDFVVRNSYSKEYGVRELKRFIKKNVSLKIAKAILENNASTDKKYCYNCSIKNNELFLEAQAECAEANI